MPAPIRPAEEPSADELSSGTARQVSRVASRRASGCDSAAPARATDLAGLPPAYVDVCEFDPLRDEGLGYAQRLIQAGVHTELHLYPGTFHGSSMIAAATVSRRMTSDANEAVRRLLRA